MRDFKLLRGYQEKRWYTIDVGHIRGTSGISGLSGRSGISGISGLSGQKDSDVQYFLDQLRRSMAIPSRFLGREVLNELLPTQDIFIPVRNEQL
jgi:hypothetical protein